MIHTRYEIQQKILHLSGVLEKTVITLTSGTWHFDEEVSFMTSQVHYVLCKGMRLSIEKIIRSILPQITF